MTLNVGATVTHIVVSSTSRQHFVNQELTHIVVVVLVEATIIKKPDIISVV